jgi:proteasome lid subunit RPN8/RPN11
MKQLACYILLGIALLTPAVQAQQVKWGDYARSQAGLQVTLRSTAEGSGLLVVLSTQDENNPAWVPEKRKSCEMIISDASSLSGCKLVNKPKAQPLSYIHKNSGNISTTSLRYVFDLDACKGNHTIVIDYSVVCKKGPGDNGKIKIPINIEAAQEPEKTITSSQPGDQVRPEDSVKEERTNPPAQKTGPDPRPDQGKDPVTTLSTSDEPNRTRENTPVQEGSSTEEADTQITQVIPPQDEAPKKPEQKEPQSTLPPAEKKSSFPYYLLVVLLALGATAYWFIGKSKKQSSQPVTKQPKGPANRIQATRQQPVKPSPVQKQPAFALKAIPKPLRSGAYTVVNLHNCWEDSSIHQVFLSKQLIQELNEFVTDQNVRPFKEEGLDAVPEIGGFILGQYKHAEKAGEWDIFLEKFKAITPGKSEVYRVSFETIAWAELAEIQDQYPSLQTLAWFHTHPGHGLFLSQPDLRIHNGFFKEKYQLAMEIDSLSEGLDTAFFSRKKSGEVNNRKDRISNRWFKWDQIMKTQESHD